MHITTKEIVGIGRRSRELIFGGIQTGNGRPFKDTGSRIPVVINQDIVLDSIISLDSYIPAFGRINSRFRPLATP
jgi:hypothetical protein